MKIRVIRFYVVIIMVVLAGCRTTKDVLDDYEANVIAGNYSASIPEVTELAEKQDGSQQLWRLMAGAANFMADDKSAAINQFDLAEEVFKKNDTTSVFAQTGDGALAMLTNDKSFSYDGGGQDRIFTCLYKAIDFMCLGKMDEARVELNRSSQYQTNWLYDRRRDIEAAAKKLESEATKYQSQYGVGQASSSHFRKSQTAHLLSNADFVSEIKNKCSFDPSRSGNLSAMPEVDYMNTYALHVAGVFRWLNGDTDRNYLRDVLRLVPGNPVLAKDYAEMDKGVSPREYVWIWVEDGLCPVREEWRLELPLVLLPYVNKYVIYAGMALPYLRYRQTSASNWYVMTNGERVPMSILADVDRLVKSEYDVYMRGALTREISRTLVKVGVQAALGAAAEAAAQRERKKGGNSSDYLALKLSQIGVATWAKATIGADLRSWTALPKSVKVARILRPKNGKIIVTADDQPIELHLPPGNIMVFIRKPSLSAMPTIKTAIFK